MLIYSVPEYLSSAAHSTLAIKIKSAAHILLIIALGLIAYSNTLDVPFTLDDDTNITDNPFIKDIANFTDPSRAADGTGISHSMVKLWESRLAGYFTFALNYRVHGLDVRGYHIVNIGIHVITAVLLYWLVLLTFETPFLRESAIVRHARSIALFSALLFVSHPVQTQAVTYIVQRFASLATLLYLLSLILYARFRLYGALSSKAIAVYVLSLLSAALAMKTKEIAFTLPPIIVLYEFLFFRGYLKNRFLYLMPVLLTMLIIPLSLMGGSEPLGDVIGGIERSTRLHSSLSRVDYLMTESRVAATYLRLLFLPLNQNLDYDYPSYKSFLDLNVLLPSILLIGVAGLGVALLRRSSRTEPALRLIAFGIFWFFVTLSVESSFIPIVDIIFEHRLYLPSVAVFPAFVVAIQCVAKESKTEKSFMVICATCIAVVISFSVATYQRNHVWRDEIRLWQDVVEKSPLKARPHNNLGYAYYQNIEADKALKQYKLAIELDPTYTLPYNNLGVIYEARGLTDKRIEAYREALRIDPNFAQAHVNIGRAYLDKGQLDKAIYHLNTALKFQPSHAQAHQALSRAYEMKGLAEMSEMHRRMAE